MPEKVDAIDDELLAAIAKVKGHAVRKAVPQLVSEIYPVSRAATEAWLKAEGQFWGNLKPGQQMPDGAIFLGKYECLSRTFNVVAAAEDLPWTMTYNSAAGYIARYEAHGHCGANCKNDKELYAAIENGSYDGGWVIPPRELLDGRNAAGEKVARDNLFVHKDTGAFKGMFKDDSGADEFSKWYWSSTEDPHRPFSVKSIRLHDGDSYWDRKDDDCFSCRPVRLVPCP